MMSVWGRRFFCLGMIFILLAGLTGCAGMGLLEKKEPVTIKFVFLENSADYQPLVDLFQKEHTDITIQLDPVPFEEVFRGGMAQRFAEADTLRVSALSLSADMTAAMLPLDGQISTDRDFPLDDLVPGSLAALQLDGRQVAIPAGINPYVMFYLPEKFKAAKAQPPTAAWRMEDFLAAATAVNQPDTSQQGKKGLTYGFCSHPQLSDVVMFTYLFGGSVVDNITNVTRPTLNERANIQALTWYASLKTDFNLLPPGPTPREVGILIARSNCAFWMDWLDRSTFGRFEGVDPAVLPFPGSVAPFSIATLDGYSISAKSGHPKEAWMWIRFLMDHQLASGVLIPPLKTQVESSDYAARAPESVRGLARGLSDQTIVLGLEMFRNERFGSVLGLYSQAAKQVFEEKIDPKTALDEAQLKAEEAFR